MHRAVRFARHVPRRQVSRSVVRHLSARDFLNGDDDKKSWREDEIMSASTMKAPPPPEVTDAIPSAAAPPPPEIPEIAGSVVEASEAAGSELVLGNWPSDYALTAIEMIHTSLDVPYWAAIVGTTLVIRSALLPLSVLTMTHAARMSKAKPEIEVIQQRMNAETEQAKKAGVPGNASRVALYQRQMTAIMAKHKCRPVFIFLFPLTQLPIFTSMFFGLQKIELLPHATTGGALWFTDLTVRDPYFVLPVATAGLFFLMVETGADGVPQQSGTGRTFRNFMRGMAFMMIPFTYSFPAAVFSYWMTANTFSLVQTTLFNKSPWIRDKLGLPPKIKSNVKQDAVNEIQEAVTTFTQTLQAKKKKDINVISDVFDAKKQNDAYLATRVEDKANMIDSATQPQVPLRKKPSPAKRKSHHNIKKKR